MFISSRTVKKTHDVKSKYMTRQMHYMKYKSTAEQDPKLLTTLLLVFKSKKFQCWGVNPDFVVGSTINRFERPVATQLMQIQLHAAFSSPNLNYLQQLDVLEQLSKEHL